MRKKHFHIQQVQHKSSLKEPKEFCLGREGNSVRAAGLGLLQGGREGSMEPSRDCLKGKLLMHGGWIREGRTQVCWVVKIGKGNLFWVGCRWQQGTVVGHRPYQPKTGTTWDILGLQSAQNNKIHWEDPSLMRPQSLKVVLVHGWGLLQHVGCPN